MPTQLYLAQKMPMSTNHDHEPTLAVRLPSQLITINHFCTAGLQEFNGSGFTASNSTGHTDAVRHAIGQSLPVPTLGRTGEFSLSVI
jgi:hypothetical protein